MSRVIESAQPSIDFTQRKYGAAHDAVVASQTYNRALEAAAEVLQRVQVNTCKTCVVLICSLVCWKWGGGEGGPSS